MGLENPRDLVIVQEEDREVVQIVEKGASGVGIPTGGLIGQVLVKSSQDDYEMEWTDADLGFRTEIIDPKQDETLVYNAQIMGWENKTTIFPQYYGVEVDEVTGTRPLEVFQADSLQTDSLSVKPFSYIYNRTRYEVPAFDGVGLPLISLNNHPAQNLYVVATGIPYDLSAYTNTYVFTNYAGSGFDWVVIFGSEGENTKFGSELPQLMEVAHIIMFDSGEISTVDDNFWMVENGGADIKFNAVPRIISGLEVINNELANPLEQPRYTLTDSTVVTSVKEEILTSYPLEITVNVLWPDTGFETTLGLYSDYKWYDDSQPSEAKHSYIPEERFSIDFLFSYENSSIFRPFFIIKGDKLFTASELLAGVAVPNLENFGNFKGYLPVAALVQTNAARGDFVNIVNIKNTAIGDKIQVVTQDWIENLVDKTQFRTQNNLNDKIEYNSYLGTGDPVDQGWAIQGTSPTATIGLEVDPLDANSVALRIFDNDVSVRPEMNRPLSKKDLRAICHNGGTFIADILPIEGGAGDSAAFGWGWTQQNDPNGGSFYTMPVGESSRYITLQGKSYLGVSDSGYVEFKYTRSNPSGSVVILGNYGKTDHKVSITSTGLLEIQINSIVLTDPSWNTTLAGNGINTIRIERDLLDFKVTINGTVRNTVSTSVAAVLEINAIGISGTDANRLADIGLQTLEVSEGDVRPTFSYDFSNIGVGIARDLNFSNTQLVATEVAGSYWQTYGSYGSQLLNIGRDSSTGDTVLRLVRDSGSIEYTLPNALQYYKIIVKTQPCDSNGMFGNVSVTVIDQNGTELNPPQMQDVQWFSSVLGFEDKIAISSDSIGNTSPSDCHFKDISLQSYSYDGEITLDPQDFTLNNIFNIEGERDFVINLPDDVTRGNSSITISSFRESSGFVEIRRSENSNVLINNRDKLRIPLPSGSYSIQVISLNNLYSGISQPYRAILPL